MIYIRKIFKQDLRDGKQIAFPKEASNIFFNFNYQNNDPDRLISFTFKDSSNELDNTIINTRLYAAASESRIDSELKRFLIDKLNVVIDDLIIFIKKDDKKYEFQHISKNSSLYNLALNLLRTGNHQVVVAELEDESTLINQTNNFSINLISKFAKWLNANPKHNYYENDYNKTLQGLERINDKYKESFDDDLFIVNANELDSKIESINTNIWDKDSTFWTFSETTSTHLPRAILNKENYQRFLREYNFNKDLKNSNTIYYGAPGTGKSYKVNQIIKDLDKQFYERVTFHPEYDNASFIGGYKPISEKNEEGKDVIKYEFVPQAFANIYKRAWQDLDNQYYLVIEEINRGNCAEIFGELFQLLDRNSGYTVAPSNELYKHLVEEFGDENHKGIIKGLQLPPNLAILATMNTSDQSLFPMDSAFKRRWEWEYVPICYGELNEEGGENKSYNFVIYLGNESQYSWIKFIEYINLNHIKENPNLGMDKCIGNYFVKPENGNSISLKQFINKVVFYLWNDVFKDEVNTVFEENSSYEDFFPTNSKGLVKVTELFERIGLEKLVQNSEDDTSINLAAEPQEPYGE